MSIPEMPSFPITGRPIDTAHEAMKALVLASNGVMIRSRGTVELHRNLKPFATIEIHDPEMWQEFARNAGFPA